MPETALPPTRLKIKGTQGIFLAQINPAEFTYGVSITYGDESTTGIAAPMPLPQANVDNETLSFSLILDDTGALAPVDGRPDLDVQAQLKRLSAILGVNLPEGTTDVGLAEVTWVGRTWRCRLNDLSVAYTLFAADGTPLRAKVQLSLSVCRTNAEEQAAAEAPAPVAAEAPAPTAPASGGRAVGTDGTDGAGGDSDGQPSATAGLAVNIKIKSNGTEVQTLHALHAVRVHHAVNSIPSASLEFIDGDFEADTMPASDGDHFKPGAEIEVLAAFGNAEPASIFIGLVIKHSLRMAGDSHPRLVIECRHKAIKMTVGRKNANYLAQTDADIIQAVIAAEGLTAEVGDTAGIHDELVQHYCSPWDFVLARAEANGLLVIVGETLSVKAPVVEGEAALTVSYGEDLIEFDAEIDARTQYTAAQAAAWDPKTQKIIQGESAAPAGPAGQGDLSSATLAEVIQLPTMLMQSSAPLPKDALTAWAKALQLKAGLARIRGRMRVQGNDTLVPGALIQLEKMGTRFNGKVYATGIRHELTDGDWTTDVEFGLAPDWFVERPDVKAPSAAGLLPAIDGLQIGTVLKVDGDPASEHRIQVSVPVLQADTAGVWARLMQFHGSKGIGSFFVPEVGDEVVLGYFGNDPSHPVVLGSLYSSTRPPAYELAANNDIKAIVTRCKSKIEFDEAKRVITVTTPDLNKLVISDTEKSILLQDQNDNKITLDPAGITLDSPKDITLSAKGQIVLDATGAVSISSKADITVKATANLQCEATAALTAKGMTSELSASTNTVVKGAMVMIN